jgi:hypothetical protein
MYFLGDIIDRLNAWRWTMFSIISTMASRLEYRTDMEAAAAAYGNRERYIAARLRLWRKYES